MISGEILWSKGPKNMSFDTFKALLGLISNRHPWDRVCPEATETVCRWKASPPVYEYKSAAKHYYKITRPNVMNDYCAVQQNAGNAVSGISSCKIWSQIVFGEYSVPPISCCVLHAPVVDFERV